jgi:two-component system, NtrC family, response regulator HydG
LSTGALLADARAQSELAQRIFDLSIEQWGTQRGLSIIGHHASVLDVQNRLLHYARAESPVLITGETGTGKELFARALYLLSSRRHRPFISVNCAQYVEGHLIVSELFGHRRGSFTGAVSDHKGVFVDADGGVVFLDEVGELSLQAQAMLLRVLSEGEVVAIGDSRSRAIKVRVIAATSRDLRSMIAAGRFREDLYFRLRFLQLRIPPLRERGDDWELLLHHYVQKLGSEAGTTKMFSTSSVETLRDYSWPGNIRELRGVVDTAFHCADGPVIEPDHFSEGLDLGSGAPRTRVVADRAPVRDGVEEALVRMTVESQSFWTAVHIPYMDREMNRTEVRAIIERGLAATRGSYKQLLAMFNVPESDYLRFMDFLRHHRLKPER